MLGTVAMLFSLDSAVLLVGRVVVGVGVGLAISSCTAWASDLKGPAGAAIAGAVLTAGFAIGPFASGLIASAGQSGIRVSFAIAAAIVVLATLAAVLAVQRAAVRRRRQQRPIPGWSMPLGQGSARALSWAMPLAPWVFASATLAFVTIPTRVHTGFAAPMVAGMATLIANGVSALIQIVARARRWGPHAGTVGALLAALGYAIIAMAPPTMTLALGLSMLLVLGCASGLLLREGLIDLEATAPQRVRGALTGAFYTVSYVGFGLPLLLSTAAERFGDHSGCDGGAGISDGGQSSRAAATRWPPPELISEALSVATIRRSGGCAYRGTRATTQPRGVALSSALRCLSVIPPQMPYSTWLSSASAAHSCTTGQ